MTKTLRFLLLLLPMATLCRAQQPSEKLRYELAESIVNNSRQPFAFAKRGPDGKYHRQPVMATDTPTVRLLLLDRPYATDDEYQVVLANDGTTEQAQLMKYFTSADVVYMRQQIPSSRAFKFEQAKIREPWVTVISLDTVAALNKRLGWRARILVRDSLLQRYGNDRTFTIGGMLFSKDHRRALANVTSDGWETCVYIKAGKEWHREATLYMVEY